MAESLLVLRTDLISFQTTKKKTQNRPKRSPWRDTRTCHQSDTLLTRTSGQRHELYLPETALGLLQIPGCWAYRGSQRINTGIRKQGIRSNTLEAPGIFTTFTTNPIVRLILRDSTWHYHKRQLHYCCHFYPRILGKAELLRCWKRDKLFYPDVMAIWSLVALRYHEGEKKR